MCIYTVGSLWGPWTSVLIIEVSIFLGILFDRVTSQYSCVYTPYIAYAVEVGVAACCHSAEVGVVQSTSHLFYSNNSNKVIKTHGRESRVKKSRINAHHQKT